MIGKLELHVKQTASHPRTLLPQEPENNFLFVVALKSVKYHISLQNEVVFSWVKIASLVVIARRLRDVEFAGIEISGYTGRPCTKAVGICKGRDLTIWNYKRARKTEKIS